MFIKEKPYIKEKTNGQLQKVRKVRKIGFRQAINGITNLQVLFIAIDGEVTLTGVMTKINQRNGERSYFGQLNRKNKEFNGASQRILIVQIGSNQRNMWKLKAVVYSLLKNFETLLKRNMMANLCILAKTNGQLVQMKRAKKTGLKQVIKIIIVESRMLQIMAILHGVI